MKPSYRIAFSGLMGLTFSLLACSNGTSVSSAIEEPKAPDTASIKDSILHRNVILYRALNFKGDTTVWKEGDCSISNTSFSCYHETCINGCTYVIRHCVDADNKRVKCAGYKDTIYDTTYKDINFGENAIVNYMPVAKIPAFNRDSVAKLFSKISGEPCSRLLSFSSNYYLEAISLPDSLTLNLEREYIPEEYIQHKDFFVHLSLITNESTGEKTCRQDSSRIMYNFYPGSCYYSSLPEKAKVVNYELFNTTIQAYKDTTISWKLVYKDQYGRGDTLDITTKFE